MVICSVGNISFPRLRKGIEKYFAHIPIKSRSRQRSQIHTYHPSNQTVQKNTYQAHAIIGNLAYDLNDERRMGLHLLNNIIGGPGLNSRLNLSLREKNGYSYHTESHYSPYSDTGVLSVYFSSDKNKLEQSRKVVMREFSKLREKKLGTLQLSKAKRQLMGQIAISAENNETLMLSMAKSYLVYNKYDDLKTIGKKIDGITSGEILEIANDILYEANLSSITYL
jgi:predicted Zn-dependent peptidase